MFLCLSTPKSRRTVAPPKPSGNPVLLELAGLCEPGPGRALSGLEKLLSLLVHA